MSETIWNTNELKVIVDDEVELQDAWTLNYITVPVDELDRFAEHWLDQRGYDVAKREPELLPCPACGGKVGYSNNDKQTGRVSHIFCTECEKVFLSYPTFNDAAEAWNALPRKGK